MYLNGSVAVSTTAAAALTVYPGTSVILQNTSTTVPIFIGSSTVTTTGSTQGYSLAAGASLTLPVVSGEAHTLYAIATAAATLIWLTNSG
jgi:hypothetical protein